MLLRVLLRGSGVERKRGQSKVSRHKRATVPQKWLQWWLVIPVVHSFLLTCIIMMCVCVCVFCKMICLNSPSMYCMLSSSPKTCQLTDRFYFDHLDKQTDPQMRQTRQTEKTDRQTRETDRGQTRQTPGRLVKTWQRECYYRVCCGVR